MLDRLHVAIARGLEALPFAAAPFWPTTRPLALPSVPVVTVGGATLGGSGKTRVALACAQAMGAVLVSHAHRARPGHARVVDATDDLEAVGDEALGCARAFSGRVVVAPTRQEAVDFAATFGRPLVIDGALQAKPIRSTLAILALDADRPWGGGDRRASRAALLAAADAIVTVPATLDGLDQLPPDEPFGLFTALARPNRLLRALARAGRSPAIVISVPDHGGRVDLHRLRRAEARIGTWLATPKCALHLERCAPTRRVVILADRFELPPELIRRLPTYVA